MRHHFVLSVLIYQEDGRWIAQALEHDITAYGTSVEDAKHAFEQTVAGQVLFDLQRNKAPLQHIEPAPDEFWDRFHGEAPSDLGKMPLPDGVPDAYMIAAIEHPHELTR